MEAYENAKEEIQGENTVFQDIAAGWHSLMDRFRTKDDVTKYDPEGEGNTDIDAMFDGNVSCLSAQSQLYRLSLILVLWFGLPEL